MKKVILSTVLGLTSLTSLATDNPNKGIPGVETLNKKGKSATYWTQLGKIEGIFVDLRGYEGGNRVLIKHSFPRIDSCSNTSANYFFLDVGTPEAQMAYSLILSSQAKNKDMRFAWEGCSTTGYPLIKNVMDH